MAVQISAIAAAIAARYAPGAMSPPAGQAAVRSSTADPPAQLGALPAVIVLVDKGRLQGGGGTRIGVSDFLVRLYVDAIAPGDLERLMAACRAWLDVLLYRHQDAVQLGGLVDEVAIVDWQVGVLSYSRQDHAGVELRVRAVHSEPWPVTA